MKIVTTIINCDTCDKDISPHLTGMPAVYILKVEAVNIAQCDGIRYAVACYAPIGHDLYFCGLDCMRNYAQGKDK